MAKLAKNLKLKTSVSVVDLCHECQSIAEMINDGDAYHLECVHCGSQGFRYETATLAREDWPKFHTHPTKKFKVAV